MAGNTKGEPIPAPEDNATPLNYREQFQGRGVSSQFIDPCAAASKASMDCMNRHDYDRDFCLDYFQAYRDCKKIWIEQRKEDRRAGRPTK
ncbi:Cytochrome c oxidase-assembly factor COX23, mitochondrial [Hypsizygus marmoreus]|uniref:Cytochrome c oxidase-assembly factor COX23, mitochondrial n=1 Tax=Hypsizygus marmoreus TaxID=39966 RepID=A0A369JFC1_HYPMA|nr:Cytochrome c oxidase-assembly factor COX23, mitochondrial [Hypsizygus marmoreus]